MDNTSSPGISLAGLMTGAAPTTPVVTAAPATVAPAPATVAPSPAPQLSVGAQSAAATVVSGHPTTVAFGEKVESVYVSRFRGVKGYTKRFAVLDPKRIFVVNAHYLEGSLKNFHCFGGACCKAENPKQSYLVPGLAYDCNKDGVPCSAKISIEYLKCSPGMWDLLTMLHRSQPIDTIDLFVMCEDDGFQKLKIAPAGPAVWRQEANLPWARAVIAEFQTKVDRILRSEARYLGKLPEDLNDVGAMAQYRKECEAAYAKALNEGAAVATAAGAAGSESRPNFDMAQFIATGKQ